MSLLKSCSALVPKFCRRRAPVSRTPGGTALGVAARVLRRSCARYPAAMVISIRIIVRGIAQNHRAGHALKRDMPSSPPCPRGYHDSSLPELGRPLLKSHNDICRLRGQRLASGNTQNQPTLVLPHAHWPLLRLSLIGRFSDVPRGGSAYLHKSAS